MDYLIFELDGNVRLFLILAALDALVFATLFYCLGTLMARIGPSDARARTILFRLFLSVAFLQYYFLFRPQVKAHPSALWVLFPFLLAMSAFIPLFWHSVHQRATEIGRAHV